MDVLESTDVSAFSASFRARPVLVYDIESVRLVVCVNVFNQSSHRYCNEAVETANETTDISNQDGVLGEASC